APAQGVVEYKTVKFTRGVGDGIPIYERRPSAAVDEAWERYTNVFAETKVPKSEAAKMVNKTYPILGDEENYILALDVFHQLHCLARLSSNRRPQDILRQQLHPGHNYTHVPKSHARHCIGQIRQALMCSADISTVVWQWSMEQQEAEQRDDIVHMCRDYDKIQDWAREHVLKVPTPDFSVYIEDDLDIPVF
ncbi:hypothetical protein B0H10DRAFT_1791774, partial [Mycena sp. CBHHK59/15]